MIVLMIKIHWLVLGFATLALVGAVALALRASETAIRRGLIVAALSVVPGVVWASATVATFYGRGRFELIPPASGLLLAATALAGMFFVRAVDDSWRFMLSLKRARFILAMLFCGLMWAVTVCMELYCISSI